MSKQPPQRGPRRYPHGSGDRNTMDSSDRDAIDTRDGGRQKQPTTAPSSPPRRNPG